MYINEQLFTCSKLSTDIVNSPSLYIKLTLCQELSKKSPWIFDSKCLFWTNVVNNKPSWRTSTEIWVNGKSTELCVWENMFPPEHVLKLNPICLYNEMGGIKFNHDELLKYPSLSTPPDLCVFVHIKCTNKFTENKTFINSMLHNK